MSWQNRFSLYFELDQNYEKASRIFTKLGEVQINIFSEIEGLRGENLSSALIRFVLLRSQDSRTKFAESLTNLFSYAFSARHRFACVLEELTDDNTHGSGRIDLIIEMDDALIGIENKFYAGFQEGQPEKYIEHLIKKSNLLSSLNSGKKIRTALVVLAPQERLSEIQKKIDALDEDQRTLCKFLSWEAFISDMQSVAPTQDSKTREVIADFSAYVVDQIKQPFIHQNASWMGSLSNWVQRGSERQLKVIADLWDFFPASASRRSSSADWAGYYFASNRGWYGFVDRQRCIKEKDDHRDPKDKRDAEFVIVVGYDINAIPDTSIFHDISMVSPNFCGMPEKGAWVLDIQKLDSKEKWEKAISSLAPRSVNELDLPPIGRTG